MIVVNPNNRLNTESSAIETPLWAGLIADYQGADILDAEALNLSLEQTEEEVRQKDKDVLLVVMGNNPSVSSTPKMPIAEALVDRIKDLNVSFTGIHPIAVGYNKYKVVSRPFEGFPMMPWDKLPMNLYRAHNWHCLDGSPRSPYASVYTSLGCPYSCYYCNIHTLYGNRQVWFRPIDDILKEIDILVNKHQVRNIKFWDELFTLKEDRVAAICNGIKGYDLNIWAYARVDTITHKMLKSMKEGGINWLAYGFESITDPKFVAQTENAIKITKEAGINIIANFMFGLPSASPKDDQATLDWAKSQLFDFVNLYTALPYPGSSWYQDVKPNYDWGSYDQYSHKRNGFRDKAFLEYFTNPEYLEMVGGKFGESGLNCIKEMLKGSPRR